MLIKLANTWIFCFFLKKRLLSFRDKGEHRTVWLSKKTKNKRNFSKNKGHTILDASNRSLSAFCRPSDASFLECSSSLRTCCSCSNTSFCMPVSTYKRLWSALSSINMRALSNYLKYYFAKAKIFTDKSNLPCKCMIEQNNTF